jgi:hypothetical protein
MTEYFFYTIVTSYVLKEHQLFDAMHAKAQSIAKLDGCVKRIDEHTYTVKSQSGKGEYDVISTELGFRCSCPDHVYRGVKCKHIIAVEISFALRENVEESQVIIPAINIQNSPRCQSDNNVISIINILEIYNFNIIQ